MILFQFSNIIQKIYKKHYQKFHNSNFDLLDRKYPNQLKKFLNGKLLNRYWIKIRLNLIEIHIATCNYPLFACINCKGFKKKINKFHLGNSSLKTNSNDSIWLCWPSEVKRNNFLHEIIGWWKIYIVW